MVEELMSADPELARVVAADGGSPLYLAVSLGRRDDIARLLHEHDRGLSYAGPDGNNALHAAVQKGKGN
jgi:ankyrin repeat protein